MREINHYLIKKKKKKKNTRHLFNLAWDGYKSYGKRTTSALRHTKEQPSPAHVGTASAGDGVNNTAHTNQHTNKATVATTTCC
jgi:hypothetical protein